MSFLAVSQLYVITAQGLTAPDYLNKRLGIPTHLLDWVVCQFDGEVNNQTDIKVDSQVISRARLSVKPFAVSSLTFSNTAYNSLSRSVNCRVNGQVNSQAMFRWGGEWLGEDHL